MFVENYLPGTLGKYGLDYETLRKENGKLVYASITGYGQTGPYADRAGYDVMVEAFVSPFSFPSNPVNIRILVMGADERIK